MTRDSTSAPAQPDAGLRRGPVDGRQDVGVEEVDGTRLVQTVRARRDHHDQVVLGRAEAARVLAASPAQARHVRGKAHDVEGWEPGRDTTAAHDLEREGDRWPRLAERWPVLPHQSP